MLYFLLLNFVVVVISEATYLLFDIGCISTVSDDMLLAIATMNILISEDVG